MTMGRRLAALGAIAVIAIAGGRAYWGPMQTLQPAGKCIRGAIDLENPAPFTQASFKGPIVGIANSGGGSRAAYLSAAILREIRRAGPTLLLGQARGGENSLLDQIDAFSSVSGGSFAASYFVMNSAALKRVDAGAAQWHEYLERMAIEYRKRQWYHEAALNPAFWVKSIFTDYNRGVLAREDYDAVLFKGLSLAQLPDRPVLYINAFDVANHVRFVFSKHYIDTTFYQPKGYWGMLWAPHDWTSENDLAFTNVDPNTIRVADAVYASSAYPTAYPNLAIRHCGSKLLYVGSMIFLADGGIADNSGLITLLTQLRANLDETVKGSTIVIIAIDASVDRLARDGTRFQLRGTEERYPWESTIIGHAQESVLGAIQLMQDVVWKFIEGTGIETDQLNPNWEASLTRRTGNCSVAAKTSWNGAFESGVLAARPLIIRLGLRDIVDADFASTYGGSLKPEQLSALLKNTGMSDNIETLSMGLQNALESIPTDFTLTPHDRRLLDLAAYLLVQGKLTGDVARWNEIDRARIPHPWQPVTCLP